MRILKFQALALGMITVLWATGAYAYQDANCKIIANQEVAKFNLSVQSVYTDPIWIGPFDPLAGYNFWYRVAECPKGYVVVTTTWYCYVEQIYSRNGCRVPGMRESYF